MMETEAHTGYLVAGRSRADIRKSALHARQVLRLPEGRIVIPDLLEWLSTFGLNYDVFTRAEWPFHGAVEACFVPGDMTIYIREDIYDEMSCGGQRAVFTFGHELGHALLAHRVLYTRAPITKIPAYANSEWQANTFSAEFTMPIDQMLKHQLSTAQRVAEFFGVSPVAASVRCRDLQQRREM